GMDEAGALLLGAFEANIESPCLKIGAVRRAGHLAVFARLTATRHPGFQIKLAVSRPSEVARTRVDYVVGQSQPLEDRFLDGQEFLVQPIALIGRAKDKHLDFRELVNAVKATRVAARRTGLGAKTVRQADVLDGQVKLVE